MLNKYAVSLVLALSAIVFFACLATLHSFNSSDDAGGCEGGNFSHLSDDSQVSLIKAVIFSSATLSFFGSIFIIFSYYYFIPLRTFPIKMIVMLSFSDLFSSLAYFVGFANHSSTCFKKELSCSLSSVMTQFFDVASFCWMTVIAFNIHQIITKSRGASVESNEKYYHAFSWGVSSLLLTVAVATGSMGDAGNWCWIKPGYVFERLFCYYGPLILMIIVMACIYIKIGNNLKTFEMHETTNAIIRRLKLYLVVFLITRIPSITNRVVEMVSKESTFVLMLLHAIFSPLQGFLNALIYGMNKKITRQWKEFIITHCSCCMHSRRMATNTKSNDTTERSPNTNANVSFDDVAVSASSERH